MADRDGNLIPSAGSGAPIAVATSNPAKKWDVRECPAFTPYWNLADKRREMQVTFARITYYRLRARDSGQPSPPLYTTWVSTNATSTPPTSPIGSWVEITITEKWTG